MSVARITVIKAPACFQGRGFIINPVATNSLHVLRIYKTRTSAVEVVVSKSIRTGLYTFSR